ncbi:hypothetical protein H2248_007375 [Termitomyces sp. 'cryptogamus']|nr:hypothetical protein H2248_007375 [Termitomyces sp. 'cryptogamus']
MDLLNENDVAPLDHNVEQLEAEWFEATDPYDLGEAECMDAANPDQGHITQCSNQWKTADLVKLDSPSLAALNTRLGGYDTALIRIGANTETKSVDSGGPARSPGDWDIDDYVL